MGWTGQGGLRGDVLRCVLRAVGVVVVAMLHAVLVSGCGA